jgi:hypothetical protein
MADPYIQQQQDEDGDEYGDDTIHNRSSFLLNKM